MPGRVPRAIITGSRTTCSRSSRYARPLLTAGSAMSSVTRVLRRALVPAALVILLAPSAAHAQLGRLKKAVSDRAAAAVLGDGGESGGPTDEQLSPERLRVEITAARLDGFAKAIEAERAERAATAAKLAAFDEKKYDRCYEALSQDPKYVDIETRGWKLSEQNQESEAVQRQHEALDAERRALVQGRCGPSRYELEDEPELAARRAGRLSEEEYSVLRERIAPFCRPGASVSKSDRGARVGRYVWTAEEAAALEPRCAAIWPSLQKLL